MKIKKSALHTTYRNSDRHLFGCHQRKRATFGAKRKQRAEPTQQRINFVDSRRFEKNKFENV